MENFDQEYDIKHDSNLVKNKPLKKQKSKLNIINKQDEYLDVVHRTDWVDSLAIQTPLLKCKT